MLFVRNVTFDYMVLLNETLTKFLPTRPGHVLDSSGLR